MTKSNLQPSEFIREHSVAPPIEPPAQMALTKIIQTPEEWYTLLDLSMLEKAYSLPTGILKHMIAKESRGHLYAISHRGAKGLFQIMPKEISGFTGDPFNPLESAKYAAKTLRNLANHFNTWEQVLAAYNWGRGNVNRKGLEKAPEETRNYTKFFHSNGMPLGNVMNSMADIKKFDYNVKG